MTSLLTHTVAQSNRPFYGPKTNNLSQIILRSNVLRHHFYLPKVYGTGPKWQWSTQQGSFMPKMHGTSLLGTPGQFGPVLLP